MAAPGANPNPPAGNTPAANPPAAPQTPNQQPQENFTPNQTASVEVRAVNPPLTPDQVVGLYDTPVSLPKLPTLKLENIKTPVIKNKTIQGYLKAIEAKMVSTEKLMKDIIKLQNVQIITEKEVNFKKRELYNDTFQEYLLDKTIDFSEKKNKDCVCINLPENKPPTTPGKPPTPPDKPPKPPTLAPVRNTQTNTQTKTNTSTNTKTNTKTKSEENQKPGWSWPEGWNLPKIPAIPRMPDLEGIPSYASNFQKGFKQKTAFLDPILDPIAKLVEDPTFQMATGVSPGAFGGTAAEALTRLFSSGAGPAATSVAKTAATTAANKIVPITRAIPTAESAAEVVPAALEVLGSLNKASGGIINYAQGGLVKPHSAGSIEKISHFLPQSTVMGYIENAPQAKGGVTIPDPVTTLTRDVRTAAGGGMKDLELYNTDSLNYFRNMSNTIMTKAAGGGLFNMFSHKPQGLRGADLKRIMHGTAEGIPELIRKTGFRGQAGMIGKGVYGSTKGWVADTYRGAGALKGILPGQGPRLNMLVPQAARTLRGATVVSERQANRGLKIAEGILSGKYTGAKAQSLMPLLEKATPTMAEAFGMGALKLLGRGAGILNAPVIGDMIDPAGTSSYDQLTGLNSYKNNPTYKKLELSQNNLTSKTNKQPTVVPLPPEYIKIPGRGKAKQEDRSTLLPPPGVKDMPSSIFRKDMGVYR